MNSDFNSIGQNFVKNYYTMFDDPDRRRELPRLYSADASLMTFEGVQLQGALKIQEKFESLTFKKIQHSITSVDCQPMFDGGVLIAVVGQLQMDEDQVLSFTQTFILRPITTPEGSSFFCQHDLFRLAVHNG